MIWEVVRAVSEVCGRERVGVRISPTNSHHDMWDSDPEQLFFTVAAGLNEIGLGFLYVVEGATPVGAVQLPFDYPKLRSLLRGTYIANNGYTLDRAQQALAEGRADLFSFGRLYIANPDLVERLRVGAPMNPIYEEGLYDRGMRGYTDYPFLSAPAK